MTAEASRTERDAAGLAWFNGLPGDRLLARLADCCSSPAWAARVAAGRPYRSAESLLDGAERATVELPDPELDLALAGHPRIGARLDADGGHASSRREQAGVAGADRTLLRALADGNRAYEERFGHIYLVRAAGRTATELLALLTERLRHDPATERRVVRAELAQINRIRLEQLLADPSRRADR